MEQGSEPPSPTPTDSPNPSSIFKDISNFKTPKPSIPNPKFNSPFPQFFTASKKTPSSPTSASSSSFRRTRRPSLAPSSRSKVAAARRLKALELEQSQSSRKTQIRKEKSLKSLAKSLTVWLNFLFENPKSCGCDLPRLSGGVETVLEESGAVVPNAKRDSWSGGCGVGFDGPWRSPKRQRGSTWRPQGFVDSETMVFSSTVFSSLKISLQDICSFEDLTHRMREYLSSESCKEILSVMAQLTKNIDEGRLKMKAHCPIVTDLGMKKKARQVLMCYNPIWLRIGLYIVFGGDSLLLRNDVNSESDQELAFLKMIVEKLLFSHAGLAKAYAYNKLVEGLYRPGYYEALGNVILKKFLLLVLVLDRAKSQSSLPIKYGIDGTDGGSSLLFGRQSYIKSSRQIIQDFLSTEVMHGEGNLVAHLVIVGYRVSYQQYPLLEYDFSVTHLFEDLQDGVRLCRAIQLLQSDHSILMKMVVPSDTYKKNLVNCSVAMQYLKEAGIPLSDEDGTRIIAEDVASGEKELTLTMLWSMFVHLQIPLLINKTFLSTEIFNIKGAEKDNAKCNSLTHLKMLLEWIQAISQKYDIKVDNFASLVDGKAVWCLIDYYLRNELRCSCCKQKSEDLSGKYPNLWESNCSDAVHNFIVSQKLNMILGNFPEVLQISDILENNGACNERSVIVLLVFLSSQLIGRKNMDQLNVRKFLGCNCQSPDMRRFSSHKCFLNFDSTGNHHGVDEDYSEGGTRNFKVLQTWWRDMAKRHYQCENKQITVVHGLKAGIPEIRREKAAKTIQSHFRGSIERRKFLKIKAATSFLQNVTRAWLSLKTKRVTKIFSFTISKQISLECQKYPDDFDRYHLFMVHRHGFVMLKKSVLLIQQVARAWIIRRRESKPLLEAPTYSDQVAAAIIIQSHIRRWRTVHRYVYMVSQLRKSKLIHAEEELKKIQAKAAVKIQLAWKRFSVQSSIFRKCISAAKIQSCWHGYLMRRKFLDQKKAAINIQSVLRCLKCLNNFQHKIATRSAIIIQSHVRGLLSRRKADTERHLILLIQSHWRACLIRKDFLYKRKAAITIQSGFRCRSCCKAFLCHRHAAIEIQRFARGQLARNRILGASIYRPAFHGGCMDRVSRGGVITFELNALLYSVRKLQRWWRRVLLLKYKTSSAITIQSHVRAWIARRETIKRKHRIVVIQSYCKGYLARKESRGRLLDIRLRVQKSAANVDDGMRLINRLVSALSELLGIRRVSSVLHTCATLDMATKHSEKCCETLVAAGAVDTLLKLICSVTRSIPDQEVLKHALSTLRNLSRYPQLADVLIGTNRSAEIILSEFLRNKEEGYFIASELLKKLCSTKKGLETLRNLPAYLKRLRSLVDDLRKKVNLEKRKTHQLPRKDDTERRLREAIELKKLIANS